ncbi:MAG: hypothetical protein U0575_05060 [Phycisphaerales bacterium]
MHHTLADELVATIRGWRGDAELSRLAERVLALPRDAWTLDEAAIIEAIVAQHLRERGFRVRFEVPTPRGRSCDFEATSDALGARVLALHVKRLRGGPASSALEVPRSVVALERIRRPYVVAIRWRDGARAAQRARFVRAAAAFIREAQLGDEFVLRDATGAEVGGCRILARAPDEHVRLVIGLPEGFGDDLRRAQRLLRKAAQQFQPGRTNVIVMAGRPDDRRIVETALLGTEVERWDRLPPRGERIAHGRAADGFWHGGQHEQSKVAAWIAPDERGRIVAARLWFRDGARIDPAERAALATLFDA